MLAHLVFLVQSVRLAMDFLAQRCVVPFFISGPNLSDISLKISAMMVLFLVPMINLLVCRVIVENQAPQVRQV